MALQGRAAHLVGLLLLACAASALKCPKRSTTPGLEIVCYTGTRALQRLENVICRCTTLVHQGHELGSLNVSDVKSLLDGAKEANPDIRVVLSVDDRRELLTSSAASARQEAASNLTDTLKEVDGVELNVTAGTKDLILAFVKGLREEMRNRSLEKSIFLALPTRPEQLAKQYQLKELSKYVDLFTVATHYLRDDDEAYRSFHPSRLMGLLDMLNTDSLVDLISGMGAPKRKILISAPASAYRFTLKRANESTPRAATVEEQPVALDRKELCDMMDDGEWTVERDEDLTGPYAFKNTTWIAFEDETSLKIKGKYVILRELAGLALRNAENDLKNDCGNSLTQSVYKAFTEMKRKTRDVVLSSLEKDLKGTEIAYPRHVRSSQFRIVRIVDTAGKIRAVREDTQTAFTCSRQGYFVHPRSCNRFYRCVKFNQETDDYSVFEFDCPAGLAFDERTEVCVWPGSLSKGSACPGSSEIQPVPRGQFRCPRHPGFYADPQNCRWFFACYDLGGSEMIPYEFRCPFGLVFDEQRLVCEWPWKVPNCNGPGHGGDRSVYNYGDNNKGQGSIVGQGGFVGEDSYADYDITGFNTFDNQGEHRFTSGDGAKYEPTGANNGQYYKIAGSTNVDVNADGGYGGQIYNNAEFAGAGSSFNGQTYNDDTISDTGSGYNGQVYNNGGSIGLELGHNGQTYSSGGPQTADCNEQKYNAGKTVGIGAAYNGQVYNADAFAASGTGYNGQTYIPVGVEVNNGPTYPAGDSFGAGLGYDGQTYDTAKSSKGASGVGYDGQYITPVSPGGYRYDIGIPAIEREYLPSNNGQNLNGNTGIPVLGREYLPPNNDGNLNGNTGIPGIGREYLPSNNHGNPNGNTGIPAIGREYLPPKNDQNFNGNTGVPGVGREYLPPKNDQSFNGNTGIPVIGNEYLPPYNTGRPHQKNPKCDENSNGDGSTGSGVLYDGQNYDNNRDKTTVTDAEIGYNRPTTLGSGDQNVKQGTVINNDVFTTSNDYDDRGGTSVTGPFNGQGTVHAGKTTQFSSDNLGPSIVTSNVGITQIPTGFTTTGQNNFYGGNTFAGNTDFSLGGNPQNQFTTKGQFDNNYSGPATDYSNKGFTNTVQNTHYNVFDTTAQTGRFNSVGYAGGTQVPLDNQQNTGLFQNDNTKYPGTAGPVIYNSSYSASPGYPTSTIIPYSPRQNTFNTGDDGGTAPVNSVIYQTQLDMGLTTMENFGKQYTNQAGKTNFNYPTRTPTDFTYNGQTQNTRKFNTATNLYDNSQVNLAGITPEITVVRDGPGSSDGIPNYVGSTIRPENFYTGGGTTKTDDNSVLIGSSITSTNNDLTKFHQTAGIPNQFTLNGNIAGNTGLRTDTTAGTLYNQGSNFNQNGYTGNPYSVSPSTLPPNFNYQGITPPPVIPFNNAQPAVELDNSGLFGNDFAGPSTTPSPGSSTVPQNIGYQTNEYYDNGGRGTIRYNNGVVANKVTQKEFRTTQYTRIPNSFIINANDGENAQSTIQKTDNTDSQETTDGTFTRGGFTKTGPTKTGITTAQVGGSGSYVIGTGALRERPDPNFIGENAFAGSLDSINTQQTTADFGAVGNTNNRVTTNGANFNTESVGYSYPKPIVQLEIHGISTTPDVTQTNYDVTSPTPLSHAPSFTNRNSVIVESNGQDDNSYSTISPIGFTTNQREHFKTTLFQAAKLPQTVTTVQPVIDNGYKTVICSTEMPAFVNTEPQTYQTHDLSTPPKTYLDVGVGFNQEHDYFSSAQGATGSSDYSDITSNFDQGNFGQKLSGQLRLANTDYQRFTDNTEKVNGNSKLIKPTQEDYNYYGQTGLANTAQRGSLRLNQANRLRTGADIPKQVYVPSSTLAPVIGSTFSKPIVAVEFSPAGYWTTAKPQIMNTATQGTDCLNNNCNRVLYNQASAKLSLQRPANGVLINQASEFSESLSNNRIVNNQASATYGSPSPSNGILNYQGSSSFIPQGLPNNAFNNQVYTNSGSRGLSNRILKNQVPADFTNGRVNSAFNNQADQEFIPRGSTNSVLNNQGFKAPTRTLIGSNVVTSIGGKEINEDVIRQSAGRGEYINFSQFSNAQSSTSAPEVTTFSGVYNQNKKVVVKLSDLHPLILGKLGAECTCKADPFSLFRGPNRQALPINSQNRGRVDLANYDESDIYVDVDTDKVNDRTIEFVKNLPSNRLIKMSSLRINNDGNNAGILVRSRGEPSPATYSPTTTARPSTTYLPPPAPSSSYLPSSSEVPLAKLTSQTQNQESFLIRVDNDNLNGVPFPRPQGRSAKSLINKSDGSTNALKDQGIYLSSNDDTVEGSFTCARPGLFRHPKFCNKFYACHWDNWKKRFTLHVFNCPVHLAFDSSVGACNYPSKGPACLDNKLLL